MTFFFRRKLGTPLARYENSSQASVRCGSKTAFTECHEDSCDLS